MDTEATQAIQAEAYRDGEGEACGVCKSCSQDREERFNQKAVRHFHSIHSMKVDGRPSDMIAGSQRRKKKALRERQMHADVSAGDVVEEGSS